MRRWFVIACLGALVTGLMGCNLPVQSTPTVSGVDFIRTSAAKTLDAVATTMIAPRGTPGTPAPTTISTTPAGTAAKTAAASTNAATPATPTSAAPCDQVSFIRDVSIPDGTLFLPGTQFTKTWELKNSGSCPWNSTYQLVFANEGDLLSGPISKPLIASGAVQPGETVKVSIDLKAPQTAGEFQSHWKIRNPAGADFAPAGKTFWTKIKVTGDLTLIDNLCNAGWRNASTELSCPSKTGDIKGAVLRVANPKFANGYQDDEPAIQLEPQQVNDGVIMGAFPPYLTSNTATKLKAIIGCAFEAKSCDARVTLTAQAAGESEQTLGEWIVTYTREWNIVAIELASKSLAGKSVTFRLSVRGVGAPTQNRVLFLGPVFEKP